MGLARNCHAYYILKNKEHAWTKSVIHMHYLFMVVVDEELVVCGCVNLWPKKMLICQFFGKWKWASNPVGVWLNNNNNMMPIAYS